ncbi:1-deoxy-D-xylulose-5-phosphate synthase [Thiococcus pfennigii]|jgi:1-deoxy-D-xylulose-5-phosphate synthase|uniref:1-deoxy-D-xylulose-5-phosphate synthase n=1 Tax=Thiococcus pfennigii TaxID=1057 RepID=UPI001908E3EF|nr:1-deoxy-D-xylulose-5-phosphate synthase [Thiococcus pfennigii]MBK1700251.1 1-deoxy-D-xylulose-5-phosphate synthase [Thiococcus pfennigii]MBK1730398.1 1-deoxy-D-xylulose-5-phosphate synthase [Thiococcus pfennigii]
MSDQPITDSPLAAHRFPLLSAIDLPADLRLLPEEDLPILAHELRAYLIDCVSRTGGHFAAGLGVVELTIALHYVFNTPEDRIVWDVGHQAYPHKILTGRRQRMLTLRQKDGISGFPKRSESPYDTLGVGHSSTSISAAMGMAVAAARKGERRQVVAVIGDGALGAGLAFEALNHAGAQDVDLMVILNDNEMSISPPVGAISNHLARLLSGKIYTSMREGSKSALRSLPHLRQLVGRWEEHVKGMVMPSTLFEELGFNYIGPLDGHDVDGLIGTLRNMRTMPGPRLLHVITQKGKGYEPAEGQPITYHGVAPFDRQTGRPRRSNGGPTYTSIFGDWLCEAGARDERLLAITPAMCEGSGMTQFAKRFPERFFDVGIAEQHAVTLAAGMACEGLKPVVAIYSTFLQRAYDQLIHDVCLQDLDVTFAVDRAGLVGEDGPTHAGSFDLSFARPIPNLAIMTPADENECRRLLETAYAHPGPAMVRYPRGTGPGVAVDPLAAPVPLGEAEVRRRGQGGVALLAFGTLVAVAQEAGEALDATVVNMRFAKPLDERLILEMASTHALLVTLEENAVAGGAGSAIGELLAAHGLSVPLLHLGLPDRYIEHASQGEQRALCGLDKNGVIAAVTAARQAGEAPARTDERRTG